MPRGTIAPVPHVPLICNDDGPAGISRVWDGWFQDAEAAINASPWERVADVIRLKDESGVTPVHVRAFDASAAPILALRRGLGSRNNPTVVTDGTVLGEYVFSGYDGSALIDAAAMVAVAGPNWSAEALSEVVSGGDGSNSSWTVVSTSSVVDALLYDPTTDQLFAATGRYNVASGVSYFYALDRATGTWADKISKTWTTAAAVQVAHFTKIHSSSRKFYIGAGHGTDANAGVWEYDIDADTATKIGDSVDFGSEDGPRCIYLHEDSDAVLIGLGDQGNSGDPEVWEWSITNDTWTLIGNQTTDFPSINIGGNDYDPHQITSVIRVGGSTYAGVTYNEIGGTDEDVALIYKDGGSPWTDISPGDVGDILHTGVLSEYGGVVYLTASKKSNAEVVLYRYNGGSSWTQIAGDGAGGWDGATSNISTAGFAEYTHPCFWYGYMLIGMWSTGTEPELWAINLATDEATLLYTFTATAFDQIRSIQVTDDGEVYVGMGAGSNNGYVYSLGQLGLAPAYFDLQSGTGLRVTSVRLHANQDVAIGAHGGQLDGLFWQESTGRVGVKNPSPARSFDIGGADGIRIGVGVPAIGAAGDINFDADDNNLLGFHDGTSRRRITHAPVDITDHHLVRGDGGATGIQETGITVDDSDNMTGLVSLDVSTNILVSSTQVVSGRVTGWTAPTGNDDRGGLASHTAQTISAPPTQSEVQNIDDSLVAASEALHALIDDLTTHGLIGT